MKSFLSLICALLIFGCLSPTPSIIQNQTNSSIQNNSTRNLFQLNMTQSLCNRYGGNWNNCESACRGSPPGTMCIEVCIAACECGGTAGFKCPPNYLCTQYLPPNSSDAVGICTNG